MKKQLIYFLVAIFLVSYALNSCAFAAGPTPAIKAAVKKYHAGDYVGCLQDCLNITYHDQKNAVAYYYMAMSYAQSGQKDKAVAAYSKVLSLSPNAMLADYATTGKRCLETPEKCELKDDSATPTGDIDKLIAAPSSDGLSGSVKKDLEQKQLDVIKNQINSDKEVDGYDLKKLNDASGQTMPQGAATAVTAATSKQPSNQDIAAAIKVLNEAGINPYSQVGNYQNPQAMQLNMLSAFNNNPVANPNDSNAMLNMIPSMMAQSKTGQGNYSPQVMQAFIMNTLTGNMMDLNSNSNKDENSSENY